MDNKLTRDFAVKFNELSHGGFNFGNRASLMNSADVSDSFETKLGVLF